MIDREKMIQDITKSLNNLNDSGLDMAYRAIDGLDEIELFNIGTSPERQVEIREERKQREEQQHKELEEKRNADSLNRAMMEHQRQVNMISSLTGKEKAFYKHIDGVRELTKSHCMKMWELKLLVDIYNNNFIDGSYDAYCYGFYKGMEYIKKLHRSNKQ